MPTLLFAAAMLLYMEPTRAQSSPIPAPVSKLLAQYGIPVSAVSIEVRDVASGATLLGVNSRTLRNPASAIKTLTTLSALEILGPHFVWNTEYLVDGALADGVLDGNLMIRGGGDPFLTLDRFWRQLLILRQRGIREIRGGLVIDNSRFVFAQHDPARFDGNPTRLYNVGPSATLINFSASEIAIMPFDQRVNVYIHPPLSGFTISGELSPDSGKCISKRAGWQYDTRRTGSKLHVHIDGSYRIRCGAYSIRRAFFDNNEYVYRLFKALWERDGGKIHGGYTAVEAGENMPGEHALRTIADFPSPPLADIITGINKYSNNVMSRLLFASLDMHRQQGPATVSGARRMLRQWLDMKGLAMPDLFVENGSGLSRKTRISSGQLADLLSAGWRSDYRAEFLSSLPLSGLDGTMRKRLRTGPLVGRARIKTGSINGVRSMAGYVNAGNGKTYLVVMLIESGRVNFQNGQEIQDALLRWLYSPQAL